MKDPFQSPLLRKFFYVSLLPTLPIPCGGFLGKIWVTLNMTLRAVLGNVHLSAVKFTGMVKLMKYSYKL